MKSYAIRPTSLAEAGRRLDWQRRALAEGFPPAEARRLAFWRWYAEQRGESGRRVVVQQASFSAGDGLAPGIDTSA